MLAMALILVLLLILQLVLAIDLAAFDHSDDTIHGEYDIRRQLESWIQSVEDDGLHNMCYRSPGNNNEKESYQNSLIVFKNGDVCDNYAFSGTLKDGYPEGKGNLKILESQSEENQSCLTFSGLFGQNIKEVKGNFKSGIPNGRVVLKLECGFEVKMNVQSGAPAGIFKVQDGHRWSVGNFIDGEVRGVCWVVDKDKVLYGDCIDPFILNPDNATVLIYRHGLAYNSEGLPTEAATSLIGKLRKDLLENATDCELMKLQGDTRCWRGVQIKEIGPKFTYDIKERKRKLSQFDSMTNCNGKSTSSHGESSSALREYFDQLSLEKVLGMKSNTTNFNRDSSIKFLENIVKIAENKYEATLSFYSSKKITFRHLGDLDKNARFQGHTIIKIVNKCLTSRQPCPYPTFTRITGNFQDSKMDGPLYMLTIPKQRQTFAATAMEGLLHGLVAAWGNPVRYPTKGEKSPIKFNWLQNHNIGLGFAARFVNGQAEGRTFLGMIGDPNTNSGFLYGYPLIYSSSGDLVMSGSDVAYLYPWYETALLGHFQDNYMIGARQAFPIHTKCENDFIELDFELVEEDAFEYYYDPPTTKRPSSDPKVRDPYEAMNVFVKPSLIEGARDGLYALRDLKQGQLVALYGGVLFGPEEKNERKEMCEKIKDSRSPCHTFSIDTHMGGVYYLPPPIDDWYGEHNSSSGWKANNAFAPDTHLYYHDIEHPRFGLMIALTALKEISAGQELYVDYSYNLENEGSETAADHEWWYRQRREHMDQLAEEKMQKDLEEIKLVENIVAKKTEL